MKKIIVVTGLGDNGKADEVATGAWKSEGLDPIIFVPRWENGKGVKPKLARLLKVIDRESKKEKIYLMGISAGASLAMNAFIQRLQKVEKMVSLCGRLRMGWSDNLINKKLQENTLKVPGFKESVKMAEKGIKKLSADDKKRILTVSAEIVDELIPIETSQLNGAKNILIPGIGHLLTITAGMTKHFGEIKGFLMGK
jgi:dienelactone hydrolase